MKKLLDYDEVTGLAYYTEQQEEKTILQSVQDCSRVLEHTKEKRLTGSGDKKIAGHISHYCDVPNGVALELLKKGINIYNLRAEDFPRFAQEIETNYPYLKVTEKKAWRPQ